jgi:hypothetical protein
MRRLDRQHRRPGSFRVSTDTYCDVYALTTPIPRDQDLHRIVDRARLFEVDRRDRVSDRMVGGHRDGEKDGAVAR